MRWKRQATSGRGLFASTLFPSAFYADPGFDWTADLPLSAVDTLDHAAQDLYSGYLDILPSLRRIKANQNGTYFSRMITWPGKTGEGTNQLADRIRYLRASRRNGQSTHNASDIAIAGDGDITVSAGLQEYAASDKRQLGFPCLVHIDLSAHNGALALTPSIGTGTWSAGIRQPCGPRPLARLSRTAERI